MSLIHRLIVGHFDLQTFVSRHPVPLQSLDLDRTRALLEGIGKQTSETEYDIAGETLYSVNGYCDCPWLSAGHNTKSEEFARTLAELEDCYLIESAVQPLIENALDGANG